MTKFLFSLLVICLTGCTWSGEHFHYHRQVTVWGLGYTDTKLSAGTWAINYRGHYITTTQARDIALLRAAYLCSSDGYPWFMITTQNSDQGRVYGQVGIRVPYPESTMIVRGLKSRVRGALNCALLQSTLIQKYPIPILYK